MPVFVLGSAVVGAAGAMLMTLVGQLTPNSYNPLRFTFLIWVMVIVGGSGDNLGTVLGGFIVWLSWTEAGPLALWAVEALTAAVAAKDPLCVHMVEAAAHVRPIPMGGNPAAPDVFRPARRGSGDHPVVGKKGIPTPFGRSAPRVGARPCRRRRCSR